MSTHLFKATLPNGQTEVKATKRPVTHVVGTIHPERGYRTFRWSAAPDSAVKELQRRGWPLHEIVILPAVLDIA